MHELNEKRVNLILSSYVWTRPLTQSGVKQHVFALYEEIFKSYQRDIYPKTNEGGLLKNTLRHISVLFKRPINVVTQGYPILAAAIATLFRRDLGLIVHTWKVPGITDERMAARIYDMALRRAINRAKAVVVVSLMQKRQLEAQGVTCPILFAPVSVDSSFWQPEPHDKAAVLDHFGLKSDEYILTVGGSDRDELYAAKVARMLGKRYVRATYSKAIANAAHEVIASHGLSDISSILVNPSYEELRALYAGAWLVCLPTITKTNPAGLTSLVEAMACGSIVAAPNSIIEGYLTDGITGFALEDDLDEFVRKANDTSLPRTTIKNNARSYAEDRLNNKEIACRLESEFRCNNIL